MVVNYDFLRQFSGYLRSAWGYRWIGLLVACLVAAGPAGAQGGRDRIFRLAVLGQSALSLQLTRETTLPELERLGFVRGRTLDVADAFGDSAGLPGLARELGLPPVAMPVRESESGRSGQPVG